MSSTGNGLRLGAIWAGLLAFLGSPLGAQTNHSGNCTGTFTAAGNPHRLTNTCTVPAGQTLTLEAGVVFEGQGFTLSVLGTLNATNATLSNFNLTYGNGSGGTLQGCTISGSSPISLNSTLVNSPAAPTFNACTISATGVAIDITGTSRPTITGSSITSNTRCLRYSDGSGGSASGNTLRFTPEGGSSRVAVEVSGIASPTIEQNTIQDDPNRADIPVHIAVDETSTLIFRQNAICVTGTDEPLTFQPGIFIQGSTAQISGNTFPCSPLTRLGIHGGVDAAAQLRAINGEDSFYQRSTLTINAGVALTIPAGLSLDGAGFTVSINGLLNAANATFSNINLNFANSSGGALSSCTISGGSPISVGGIAVQNPTAPTINGCTISATSVAIDVSGASQPTITGNTITSNVRCLRYTDSSRGSASGNTLRFTPEAGSSRVAVEVSGAASPTIEQNTIQDDPNRADVPVHIAVDETSTLIFRQNAICVTGADEPLTFQPGIFIQGSTAQISGNTFPCSPLTRLGIHGGVDAAAQLRAINGEDSFYQRSTLTINAGVALTIPAGLSLDGNGFTVSINGLLNAANVTFSNINLSYRDGSGGTLSNCAIAGSGPISLVGSSVQNPAAPTINACAISATSVAVDAGGSSRPTITGNTITSNFRCLRCSDGSRGSFSGNTLRFVPEGGQSRSAVELLNAASPAIEGNTIEDDPNRTDVAVHVAVDPTSGASFRNNSICATGGDTPLRLQPGLFALGSQVVISDNTFPCAPLSRLGLLGAVNADSQLRAVNGQSQFRLASTLSVADGATLTIPQGISIDGENHSALISGALNIAGATAIQRVNFNFRPGSGGTIEDSRFVGVGNDSPFTFDGANVVLRRNRFESMGTAVSITRNATVLLEENVFVGNRNAIEIANDAPVVTTTRNRFEGNGASLQFSTAGALFSAFPSQFPTSVFAGRGQENTILLPATINESGTLSAVQVAYRAPGMNIAAGQTLVIQPGTVIQFTNGAQLAVAGDLVAAGTEADPIAFTATDPKNGGRWGGINIRNKPAQQGTSIIRNCIIEFANNGVTYDNASVPLEGCAILDCSGDGISLTNNSSPLIDRCRIVQNGSHGVQAASGSNPVIRRSDIFGNGSNGVQNDSANVTISAEDNYWGHDTGPRDVPTDVRCNTLSNLGGGDEVSDCVDFDPWVSLGPSVAGTLRVVSGSGQSGLPGTVLPQPLVVEVLSPLNSPLRDIQVIFSVVAGDAAIVEAMPVATGANGRAQATVRLGATPGPVIIALTARDVDSPLTTFLGETNAPCLVEMRVLAATAIAGRLHDSPLRFEIKARPIFSMPGGAGKTTVAEETVFAADSRISSLEAVVEPLGRLDPAPEGARGDPLFLRTLYLPAGDEDPSLRRLYVGLEGEVARGGGGLADLAAALRALAERHRGEEDWTLDEMELAIELRGLSPPAAVWLKPLPKTAVFEHYNTLVLGYEPATASLRLFSEVWEGLPGGGDGVLAGEGGASTACTGPEGITLRFALRSRTLLDDLDGDTALRVSLTVREDAPELLVCLSGPVLDSAWLESWVESGALDAEASAELSSALGRVDALREEVNGQRERGAALAAVARLEGAIEELARLAEALGEALPPELRAELEAFLRASRAELESIDGGRQVPGDVNQDLSVDLADAVRLLGLLFLEGPKLWPCESDLDAPGNLALIDWGGDGAANLSDAIGLLNYLFRGGPPHVLGPESGCKPIPGCPDACSR